MMPCENKALFFSTDQVQLIFFSADAFSNWCAATALSHTLLGNKELKEQLLRVQLATGIGTNSFW